MQTSKQKSPKSPKQMERHIKGISNHYRIAILLFISKHPGTTLERIVQALDGNEKTIGEHARRLAQAGLLNKRYRGTFVEHSLSPYGKLFARFLQSLQNI
jgi:predicted transcriptional regulator